MTSWEYAKGRLIHDGLSVLIPLAFVGIVLVALVVVAALRDAIRSLRGRK